jgi:hypothetical protein
MVIVIKQIQIRNKHLNCKINRIWDSSAGIATGYGLDGRSSSPGRGNFRLFLYNVQTGSRTHPVSYSLCTGGIRWGDFLAT